MVNTCWRHGYGLAVWYSSTRRSRKVFIRPS